MGGRRADQAREVEHHRLNSHRHRHFALAAAALFLLAAHSTPAAKPLVYKFAAKEPNNPDYVLMRAHYAEHYTIVEISNRKALVPPKAKQIIIPRAVIQFGELMTGTVRVACIVTADGRLKDAFVVRSTNRQLNSKATTIIEQWRAEPARLRGVPVAMMIYEDFVAPERNRAELERESRLRRAPRRP